MLLRLFPAATRLLLASRGATTERVELGDASLVVHRAGPPDGEPWVLLHGLGATGATWLPLVPELARDCRIVLPELSPLGGSRLPAGPLTVGAGARLLARFIERELPGRPPTLAGTSLGGWLAVRLALERPELVSRLLLLNAAGFRDQDWERIQRLVTVETFRDTEELFRALFREIPWWLRFARYGLYRAYTSEVVREMLAGLRAEDAYGGEDLAGLHRPAGLLWGEHDGLFVAEAGARMAAAMPVARFYLLSGCSHAPQWEHPAELLAAVRRFRTEVRPAGDEMPSTPSALIGATV
jgi:pimeloyl-ACP methyl ester carboxylesterase